MKAADYLTNSTFLSLIARWQADGRAPLCGADWLYERGLTEQGDAWKWAAATEMPGDSLGSYRGGFQPFCWNDQGVYWWTKSVDKWYNCLPSWMDYDGRHFPSFPAAIVWFLDRWAEVYAPAPVECHVV